MFIQMSSSTAAAGAAGAAAEFQPPPTTYAKSMLNKDARTTRADVAASLSAEDTFKWHKLLQMVDQDSKEWKAAAAAAT